ncbi:MAG: biotin--[acetyl-CoA-carboxylase] ligase [Syntrophomonadaceae bacterium]|nr:biotin--[acetyl-CoA-carboxylase] ligase [Syntrophomonadaceae bacterium]
MKKALISALSSSSEYISGEQLSQQLGVSRTAIWKQIQTLREQGYEIEAQPRVGYRLRSKPDRLLPEEITNGLSTSYLGQQVIYYDEVETTNEAARRLAQQGAMEGTLVVAERQTRGKGRLGRHWVSPRGEGLWFSFILRPQMLPVEAPRATLVSAVAVARAIRQLTGLEVKIKWPNDLLLEGKKVTGILTEMNCEIDRINYLVVGIGINVNLDPDTFPSEISKVATSISFCLNRKVSRVLLLQKCLEELEHYYNTWKNSGFESILVEWRELSYTLGKWTRVKVMEETVEGLAEDVEEDGSLRLRLKDGRIYRVIAGDVLFGED